MEEWRDIPGYEGYYQASNMGRVRSLNRVVTCRKPSGGSYPRRFPGIIITPFTDESGYCYVFLQKDGVFKRRSIHSIVLKTFVGERPENHDCNHLDGHKANNRLENLEYCTQSENMIHAFRVLGRTTGDHKGEKHGMARLTEGGVLEIRRLYATGEYTQKELADMFNVRQTNISAIVRRSSWGHI